MAVIWPSILTCFTYCRLHFIYDYRYRMIFKALLFQGYYARWADGFDDLFGQGIFLRI